MAQAMRAPSARGILLALWQDRKTARLGAQCIQWISTRGKEHVIRLVHTRNYVPRRGFHADWLLFQEDEPALQFLDDIPAIHRFRTAFKAQSACQIIATRMEERLQRGGFDVGKHPPGQRRAIAHRFIELDDKLREIDEHCRGLELAEQLSLEWTTLSRKCHEPVSPEQRKHATQHDR